jgi:hypothetical protein
MGVPANFSPIKRDKNSFERRGQWFTTMCWGYDDFRKFCTSRPSTPPAGALLTRIT